MSRSYKKEAIIKDKGFQKNEYNKRLRRKVKPFVKKAGIEDNQLLDEPNFIEVGLDDNLEEIVHESPDPKAKDIVIPNTHEVTNDYNVSDYRSRWDNLELAKMTGREKRKFLGK